MTERPEHAAPRTNPRLVLLVEDEPDARTILARRLQAFGWNCLPHPSVESALHDPELRYVEAVVAGVVLGDGKVAGIELISARGREEVRPAGVAVTSLAGTARRNALLHPGS